MSEYMRQEVWPLLEDQSILTGAEEHELKNFIEPIPYGGMKTFGIMWDGLDKGFTTMSLGKAGSFQSEYEKRTKERDAEMKGWPEEYKESS